MPKINRHRTIRTEHCYTSLRGLGNTMTTELTEQPAAVNPARHMVENLVDAIANEENPSLVSVSEDEFSCSQCKGLLHQPVTAPCGHSFCCRCSQNTKAHCRHCKKDQAAPSFSKLNVVLKAIVETWYPKEYAYCQLTHDGNELMGKKLFKEAEAKFSQALQEKPFDNYVMASRAMARKALGDWKIALTDIVVIKTRHKYFGKQEFNCKDQYVADIINQEIEISTKAVKMFLDVISLFGTGDMSVSTSKYCEDLKPFGSLVSQGQHVPIGKFSAPVVHAMKPANFTRRGDNHLLSECKSALDAIISENLSSTNLQSTVEAASERSSSPFLERRDSFDSEKFVENDYCCILCTRPFFDPVCTPCGHTFCLECLERCFDHGRACPMCKTALSDVYQYQKFLLSIDWSVDSFIKRYLPTLCEEKEKLKEEESSRLRENLPVFVCTVAYPQVQCLLHVFEPRYRLMIRRALKLHGGTFGMAIPSSTTPFHYVGTVISLENVSFYPDGRSLVTATGTRRFEVEEYGSCDGYCTAKIKYISDIEDTDESEVIATKNLANEVYQRAKLWFENSSDHIKQTIQAIHGNFPEQEETSGTDGPKWSWWLVAALPLKDDIKVYILGKNRLRTRLNMLNLVLQKIESKT